MSTSICGAKILGLPPHSDHASRKLLRRSSPFLTATVQNWKTFPVWLAGGLVREAARPICFHYREKTEIPYQLSVERSVHAESHLCEAGFSKLSAVQSRMRSGNAVAFCLLALLFSVDMDKRGYSLRTDSSSGYVPQRGTLALCHSVRASPALPEDNTGPESGHCSSIRRRKAERCSAPLFPSRGSSLEFSSVKSILRLSRRRMI